MNYKKLSDVAYYSELRTRDITIENYITTDNMLPNIGGICTASSIPDCKTARYYEEGDILLSNIRPYFCKIWYANRCGSASNDVLVIKNKEDIDSKFLYYVLCDKNFFNYDTVTSKGTKMPRGTPNAIMKYLVPDVDDKVQKKIASVLSAYDDLIEKNNRKIEILQDMAEELYKEWFVRFRFPGYKTAKFTDGIPDGWEVDRIESLGVFTRGKNITASEMIDGSIPVISAGIEPSGFHNESNVKGVSITISSSGANAGYMRINYSDIWAADCIYVNNIDNVFYLYELLNNIRPCIDNLQRGAAQPHVYSKDVNRLKILLPAEEVRNKFNDLVKDMHLSIATLMKQNNNLKQQRDLLLPRLMSGKLAVKVS